MTYPKFDETFAEQIDYKSIIINQIEFIHEGMQLGNQQMINNGILSLELLLFPKLDDKTIAKMDELRENCQKNIKALPKAEHGRNKGEYDEAVKQINFNLQIEKYRLMLVFCEQKDLLATEVETEEL